MTLTPSKNILIIGGSGFIGQSLVPALLSAGHAVTLLNRGTHAMAGVRQLNADRLNAQDLVNAAKNIGFFDAVIDTSAYTKTQTELAWQVFSSKTYHWIHLSTIAVYADVQGKLPDETDPIGSTPTWGQYGSDKAQADQFLIDTCGQMNVTILRPPYLYGPHNTNDRETFVWSRILQRRPVLVPHDGRTAVQFLHVLDLVKAFERIIDQKPKGLEIYNIAADEQPSLLEWVQITAHACNAPSPAILTYDTANAYHPRQYFPFKNDPCCLQTDKIKQALGWQATYTLEHGLRQTYGTQNIEYLTTRALNTTIEDALLAAR